MSTVSEQVSRRLPLLGWKSFRWSYASAPFVYYLRWLMLTVCLFTLLLSLQRMKGQGNHGKSSHTISSEWLGAKLGAKISAIAVSPSRKLALFCCTHLSLILFFPFRVCVSLFCILPWVAHRYVVVYPLSFPAANGKFTFRLMSKRFVFHFCLNLFQCYCNFIVCFVVMVVVAVVDVIIQSLPTFIHRKRLLLEQSSFIHFRRIRIQANDLETALANQGRLEWSLAPAPSAMNRAI